MGKLHRTLLIVRLNFLDWKKNRKSLQDLSWHSLRYVIWQGVDICTDIWNDNGDF